MKLVLLLATVLAAAVPVFSYGQNCNNGCYLTPDDDQCTSNIGCAVLPCSSAENLCCNPVINGNCEQCIGSCVNRNPIQPA